MPKITTVKAITNYFGDVRKVSMDEMKALSVDERLELAEGIVLLTGDELIRPTSKIVQTH